MRRLLAATFLAVAAASVAWLNEVKWQRQLPPGPERTGVAATPPTPTPGQAAAPHPVSLPAFTAKTFAGQDFELGRVLARNDAYTRHYVTYQSGALTISGVMNVPTGAGPFPLLVLNHGYIDPAVYTNGRGLKREQDYLARRGYVVLHPDYRGHADSDDDPDAEFTFRLGYAEDAINAVLTVRDANLPFVDAERVGMLGHSMGGGVTVHALLARPELVDAAVLFAPVSADARDNFERWTQRRPEVAARIVAAYGAPTEQPAFWDNLSALNFLDRISAPMLLHHGTADESVPPAWSERLATTLEAAGKTVTFYSYPGEPHEFAAAWPTVMARTVAFFDQYLKAQPPAP